MNKGSVFSLIKQSSAKAKNLSVYSPMFELLFIFQDTDHYDMAIINPTSNLPLKSVVGYKVNLTVEEVKLKVSSLFNRGLEVSAQVWI